MKTAFYLRVSTADQTTDNQLRELQAVAEARKWTVVRVYKDEAYSGKLERDKRPALKAMLEDAHAGKFELVAAWSVDRLGRSVPDLLRTSYDLRALDVQLYLHKQAVDTTTPTGRLTYTILASVAEWEREMITERINAGLARARAEGKKFGRPVEVPADLPSAIRKLRAEDKSLGEIAKLVGVSKTTVARYAKRQEWLD